MAITAADVIDIAPEFASGDVARIARFIARAKLSVNESVFGRAYELAVAYLTAHMLAVSTDSTAGGGSTSQITTSEKVGDLARTYADTSSSVASDDSALARTKYGQEFLRLRRQCVISPIVVTQSGSLDE